MLKDMPPHILNRGKDMDISFIERCDFLRKMYAEVEPHILDSRKRNRRYSPYLCDWSKIFTPIEDNIWLHIRYTGIPMFPQYPVLNYLIDFADPYYKIGIEADGKEFHLDKEKDKRRDERLMEIGWRIIRIKGKDTYKYREDYASESDYLSQSAQGIIHNLHKHIYSEKQTVPISEEIFNLLNT
jgi:very-short-patch-repair endonuclease